MQTLTMNNSDSFFEELVDKRYSQKPLIHIALAESKPTVSQTILQEIKKDNRWVPDLCANWEALETILAARPHVLNHNTETVPRLYRKVRPQGEYQRSLELIRRAREIAPWVYTKSGIMVGMSETYEEVLEVMRDLRSVDCDIITIGQYLQPSAKHLTLHEFVTPEQFEAWRVAGEAMGFLQVVSSPLTRSSYHAEQVQALMKLYPK